MRRQRGNHCSIPEVAKGYIYLGDDIDDAPDADEDYWWLGFLSRTYRKALIPPEEVRWSYLEPEQREFFKKYRPDVVDRFVHDE